MMRAGRLALCGVLLASSCGEDRDEQSEHPPIYRLDDLGRVVLTERAREAVGLETTAAVEGGLTTTALRFGKVLARPEEDVFVVAPVTGRLRASTLVLGAQVSAGDLLVTLEPLIDTASRATVAAQRRELDGQVEGARAQIEARRTDLRRVTTLVSSGLATAADQVQAEAALTAEQARAQSLRQASGELLRVMGGRLEVRAPASGVVAMLETATGALIAQGTVLARLVRAGPRWIDVSVPPGDPLGSGYRIRGFSDTVQATLSSRGAVIQTDGTRRDRLAAGSEAAASLPPGATVPVEVLHETRGLLVPAGALVRRGRETLVFVELEAGRYEARGVEVSARDESRAAVTSGVAPGDRIVSVGAASLLGELGMSRAPE
jgi:cobalt-zinc-cadmium efflux system membrane fusion protein